MALNTHLDDKLKKLAGLGSGAFTVSGASATITGTLSGPQLEDLIRAASLTRYEVVVAAGVVTVQPRS